MAKRNIVVLGINDGHDAGAALVKNGDVIAAVQEERLNNIKHYTGLPEKSIMTVFKIANIDPSEISLISLFSFIDDTIYFRAKTYAFKTKAFVKLASLLHSDRFLRFSVDYVKRYRTLEAFRSVFEKLGLLGTETLLVEHHTAHAAAAYRSSTWDYKTEDVLVLTADASGDSISSTVNIGRSGKIERIAFSPYYDSLGLAFYNEITRYLGLKPNNHEGKVMGLAPYGRSDVCLDKMRRIIRLSPVNPLRFQNTIGAVNLAVQPKLYELLRGQRFDDIAAAAQHHLEELIKNWVKNSIRATGINKIACAGGIFMNVGANRIIREMEEVEDVFFYPAPGDDGSPVGAALQGYYEYCTREGVVPDKVPITHTYYGPSYDNDYGKEILANSKLKYEYYDDIDGIAGELLVRGKILARCTGGIEWGPRALGNRSIIADPRDMRTIHKINSAIKKRSFWMPFAPSILEDRKDDYLINPCSAPYMIIAFDSTSEADKIPAAIHSYDRTCRPQTVKKEWNPNYYKILKTFESSIGVGAILNTSFNLHGYPTIGTPEIALWTFENTELDGLILGNYLVTKSNV